MGLSTRIGGPRGRGLRLDLVSRPEEAVTRYGRPHQTLARRPRAREDERATPLTPELLVRSVPPPEPDDDEHRTERSHSPLAWWRRLPVAAQAGLVVAGIVIAATVLVIVVVVKSQSSEPSRMPSPASWSRDGCNVSIDGSVDANSLIVIITVTTVDPAKRISFSTWHLHPEWVKLTDDSGRRYHIRHVDETTALGMVPGLVTADRGRADALHFDIPSTVKYLDLDLDAIAVERTGVIRVRISGAASPPKKR